MDANLRLSNKRDRDTLGPMEETISLKVRRVFLSRNQEDIAGASPNYRAPPAISRCFISPAHPRTFLFSLRILLLRGISEARLLDPLKFVLVPYDPIQRPCKLNSGFRFGISRERALRE